VFLIGGGNSAGQAAMLFANYARSVTILVRGKELADSMSRYLIDQLATKENVRIELESEVVNVAGSGRLESIVIKKRRSGEQQTKAADSLFAFIGADAETAWLPGNLICDRLGYICTGRDIADLDSAGTNRMWPLERDPHLLESSVPGIFAVGDVRHGSIKRVASSVGEGSMAIAFIHQYLAEDASKQPAAMRA
jgi:thioredoxin reductase (NADPH)